MTGRALRSDPAAAALAMLFAALTFYCCCSFPGLVARWGASPLGIVMLLGWGVVAGWSLSLVSRAPGKAEWAGSALVALLLRLASLAITVGRESPSDPHWYLLLARHVLDGQGLTLFDPSMQHQVWAEFPPAYPMLLAGWGAVVGLSAGSVLALSTLLDLGAAVLIARLGRRLGDAGAGRAAAALYLVWPSTLLSAPLAQKESLVVMLVLLLAQGWMTAERARWRTALAIGVPAALLALTQPGMAALAGLFGLAQLPRLGWRQLVTVAVAGGAVAVAAMLPWWWRNWTVFHAFVPLTSIGGLSLWIGENPAATGNWMPYPRALPGLGELQCARTAGHLATAWMAGHPLEVLRLNAAKFVRAAGVAQFALVRLAAMRPTPATAVTAALLPVSQLAHLLLLGGGAAALLLRRDPRLTALLLAIIAQLLLFGLWFEFGERHRELLTPFLLLGIAMTAAALRRRIAPIAASWAQPAA